MELLEKINQKINEINEELKNFIETVEFQEICEFTIDEAENIPWEKLKGEGIYLFEIKKNEKYTNFKTWVQDFKTEWENPLYKRRFVPNLKAKRIKKHDELNDWTYLYLGKSKNIKSRIQQHIFLPLEQNTFAMKLKAREHLINETFRLSIILIPSTNYDFIVPQIEKALRSKLNPIIGKQ